MLRFTGVKLKLHIFILSLIFVPSLVFGHGVRVTWNKNLERDLAGYLVYCGTSPGLYDRIVGADLTASVDILGLEAGRTYYFAVTARDTSGNQSGYSQLAEITIPAALNSSSVINSNSTLATGDIISGADSFMGAAVDRVEEFLRSLLGHAPDDPLTSLNHNAAQSAAVVSSGSLVMNNKGTVTDKSQLYDDIERKYPVRDAVMQSFTPFDLTTLYPSGVYFFYPLEDGCPDIDKDMIIAENPGRYLYMVFNELGDVAHVLRLSIAHEIFQLQTYDPLQALFLEDEVYGVAIRIPANAAFEAKPIAIGWGGTELFPGSAELALGENSVFFDILPYGLELDEQAMVTLPFQGSRPFVQVYDEKALAWVTIEDVQANDGYVSFSTQTFGRFKVSEQDRVQEKGNITQYGQNESTCFVDASRSPFTSTGSVLLAVVSSVLITLAFLRFDCRRGDF